MSAGFITIRSQVRDPGYPTPSENYPTNSKGILSWVFALTTNASESCTVRRLALAIAGLLALLIRLHLFGTRWTCVQGEDEQWCNQVLTLHVAIMVFLFIIPACLRRWVTFLCR